MKLWGGFPFVRFSIALIAGIVCHENAPHFWVVDHFFWWIGTLFSVLVLSTFLRGSEAIRTLQGLLAGLLFAYLGGVMVYLNAELNADDHYTHFDKISAFQVVVVSDATERKDYFRYDAKLVQLVDSTPHSASGKLHLYQRKSTTNLKLNYGSVVFVKGGILPVQPPKNPNEFDYRDYLRKQNIFGHVFVSDDQLAVVGFAPPSRIMQAGLAARAKGMELIRGCIPQPREQAILGALLLGVKDYLDNDIKEAYSSAGAMHVLAVSGLHVGIVFYLLGIAFGFLKRTNSGKVVFMLLTLVSIWIYALITGFSPSVLRAVVMFSVIIISGNLGKRANVYNSLGIAALILLVYDPFLIYSVGFQLSFVAVFGIVYLHPRLYHLWEAPNRIVDYVWSITCVSIAAQVATFPLTMLYFHQFPTYFLVSNLVVIPAASLILISGIAMLLAGAAWLTLGTWIGWLTFAIVWSVNEAMMALLSLPYPLFDWLYFDLVDTLIVYLILIALAVAFAIRARTAFVFALLLAACWSGWFIWKDFEQQAKHEVVVYEIKNHTAIDLIAGKKAILLLDTLAPGEEELIGFQINPYRLANGLPPVVSGMQQLAQSPFCRKVAGGFVVTWGGQKILILNEKWSEKRLQEANPDLLIVNADQWSAPPVPTVIGTFLPFYKKRQQKNRLEGAHSLSIDGYYRMSLAH